MTSTLPAPADGTRAAALERAKRSLWQGLALDVVVAVAAALLAWIPEADVATSTAWLLLATTLIKTVLQAAASYVLRLKLQPATELADGAFVVTDLQPTVSEEQVAGTVVKADEVREL